MPAEHMGQVSRALAAGVRRGLGPVSDRAGDFSGEGPAARMEALQARLCAFRADAARHQAPARRLPSRDRSDLDPGDGRCGSLHHLPSGDRATQPARFVGARSLFARIRPSRTACAEWGCTVCHRGQGAATEVAEAHETTLAWEQPLLPVRFIQASCGTCHRADLPETPQLDRGRQLLADLNCAGCHRLQDVDRPEMLGPDLTNIGTKVSRQWIYKWLKEPRTVTDSNGNVDGKRLRLRGFAAAHAPVPPDRTGTARTFRLT